MTENLTLEPTEQEIREEAFRIYLESGRVPGRELQNWLDAKQRLQRRLDHGAAPAHVPIPELHFPPRSEALRFDTPNPFPRLN